MIEIRPIRIEEVSLWLDFRIKALNDAPSAFLASPEEELAQGVGTFQKRMKVGGDSNMIFGAFDDLTLIGTVGLVQAPRKKAHHIARIWGVYVSPHFRGQKLAKRLMEGAIFHAKEKLQVDRILLGVESNNRVAQTLYESMGFKRWAIERDVLRYEGKSYDEYHYELILNKT